MASLPFDPISQQSGPFNTNYTNFANHVTTNPSIAPYSLDYAQQSLSGWGGGTVLGANTSAPSQTAYTYSAPAPAPTYRDASGNTYSSQAAANEANAERQYWDDQAASVNSQMGRLDTQQNIGLENLDKSYYSGINNIGASLSRDENTYNANRTNTIQDQQTAKGNIDTGVRTGLSSLRRVLGAAGSGNSSAAKYLAPYATAREGSVRRNQVNNTYSRNLNSLDTNWSNTKDEYSKASDDLYSQLYNKQGELKGGIANTRATLLEKLQGIAQQKAIAAGGSYEQARTARAAYEPALQSLFNQVDNYGRQNFNLTPRQVTYKAPTMDQYNFDRFSAPTQGNAAQQNVGSYWNLINKEDDDKKQQVA